MASAPTSQWFSPVSSTNKTGRHDITEILLKMVLNTITLTLVSKLQQFDGLLLVFLYNKSNHNDITEIIVVSLTKAP
jgi:hypothetical protein